MGLGENLIILLRESSDTMTPNGVLPLSTHIRETSNGSRWELMQRTKAGQCEESKRHMDTQF